MIISSFLLLLLFGICTSRSSMNRDRVPQISESFRLKNYFRRTLKSTDSFRASLKALLDCEMFRATCLAVFATLWRDKLHDKFHSVTYLTKAKSRCRCRSSNLSCNDFGRCMECYTVKLFRVTCPAAMSPKLCKTICTKHFSVTEPLPAMRFTLTTVRPLQENSWII